MKRISLVFLTLTLLGRPQRIPRSYQPDLEEDMNQIPLVMDEKLYQMSCSDIRKNSLAIKVLQDEIHTYMKRTDQLVLRITALEGAAARPWYKRLFHKN